ncbi:uncharacterized protein B0T15DRAFT_511476 [Chaetomium strumarium]|uniref:Uncharacterized protein n=1 Tax=Chaetomium strumarium TaxID=1170767 RepID=A0AAJ0GT26_9PEZI|nr:hypothetical protein B0T15DRAFT_511476 [Chaetomium strumarium]
MAPWARLMWAAWLRIEDVIVAQVRFRFDAASVARLLTSRVLQLLRSPSFHRGVRRIHRTVEELRYGRDPSEPLRQGEATADPTRSSNFLKHFFDELKNQARGKPSEPPNPPKR